MTVQIKGLLELDLERGVIYFHSEEKGHSALRICNLPTPVPDPSEYGKGLDITHMQGCSWQGKKRLESSVPLRSTSSLLFNNINDPCPKCGTPLDDGPGGGVECNNCGYWFCF